MSRSLWISLAVVIVLAGLGVAASVLFSGSSVGTSGSESSLVQAINSSPESYYGRRVRVRDSVNHVYGSHALTLGEGTQPGLLVVLRSPGAKNLPPLDAYVFVSGVVQQFGPQAWRRWAGARFKSNGILSSYDGQPAIHATKIQRLH